MKKAHFLLNFFTLLFVLIFILVAAPSSIGVSSGKDTLIVQISGQVLNIDPRVATRSTYDLQIAFQYLGFLGMLAPGETIYTVPAIAESWSSTSDGSEWTFTLREGLTFHDGTPINARAVEYSIYAYRMARYGLDNMSLARATYQDTIQVTYPPSDPNGYGLIFTLNGSYFPEQSFVWQMSGSYELFSLVPYGSHGAYSDDTSTCQSKLASFRVNPISCGPYKFVEQTQQDVLLERFDDWFGWGQTLMGSNGEVYTFPVLNDSFRYVRFRTIEESTMAVVELTVGGVDVTTGRLTSSTALQDLISSPDFAVYQIDILGGAHLDLNIEGDWPTAFGGTGNYPVSQKWFRRAISHAINRTNIVVNAHGGIANERNAIYPDWILSKFSGIDNTDYYNFGSEVAQATSILNAQGYAPLGFSNEPDNRFGYGPFLNETEIVGVTQTNGKHFNLITSDCDFCIKRALSVQKDLRDIGIYVDVDIKTWNDYLIASNDGNEGWDYNFSIPVGTPDPNYVGPQWDFTLGGVNYYYELPISFVQYESYAYYMYYGAASGGIYNETFELALAKMLGGRGFLDWLHNPPSDSFPFPKWHNDDIQFITAAEDAGEILSSELFQIPLVWYTDTYAFKNNLHNFLGSRSGRFHCAYSWWEDDEIPTTTTTTSEPQSTTEPEQPTSTTEPKQPTSTTESEQTTLSSITSAFEIPVVLWVIFIVTFSMRRKKRKT